MLWSDFYSVLSGRPKWGEQPPESSPSGSPPRSSGKLERGSSLVTFSAKNSRRRKILWFTIVVIPELVTTDWCFFLGISMFANALDSLKTMLHEEKTLSPFDVCSSGLIPSLLRVLTVRLAVE